MDEVKAAKEKRRLEVFLGRRYGMRPETRESVNQQLAELEWTGICRRCKVRLKGTLDEVRGHKCDG